MQYSIVIPVFEEAGNVVPLLDELTAALTDPPPLEVIFVDDGSGDGTAAELAARLGRHRALRVLRHDRRHGQSAAIRSGVAAARGDWILTMDGDGQNDPKDAAGLIALAMGDGRLGLVGGLRANRRAKLNRRLASRFANGLRRRLIGDGCPDTGCGLKLFRREAFLRLPYFDGMHRFLPALFQLYGHGVAYRPVNDRPRRRGRSKYGNLRRGLVGTVDLLGVLWLQRRTPIPLAEEHRAPTAAAPQIRQEASE